jgi:hypothetical protein
MAVKELYEWFVLNFEHFSRQKNSAMWKNSIRHNLSAKVLSQHTGEGEIGPFLHSHRQDQQDQRAAKRCAVFL